MTDDRRLKHPGTSLLVCPAVLAALVEDLGEAEAAAFVERFVRLWPQRRERLHVAIRRCDPEKLWDAAHSLTSSARMAGAYLLADASSQLHAAVPASDQSRRWMRVAALVDYIDRLGADSVAGVLEIAGKICPPPGCR